MSLESLAADSFRATVTGFTCQCAGELKEFRDEDVVALRIRKERIPSQDGSPRAREWLSIRVLDPNTAAVEVDAEYSGPDDNFLAPFRDRLLASLSERASAALLQEGQCDGGAWTINLDGLTDKPSGTQLRWDEVARAAWQDGHFCLWRAGSDRPAVCFAAEEENTYLLPGLVKTLLRSADVEEGGGPHFEPGRCEFEFRDTSFPAQVAMGVAAGACLALAIGAVKLALVGQPALCAAASAAALAALAALGLVWWKYVTPSVLRLSENALAIHCGRETIVPLAKLAGFSAAWTDFFRDGVYQQTRASFRFSSDDAAVPTLAYDAEAMYDTPKFQELERFQSHLAELVARRMCDELTSAGRVPWTTRLALNPDGLEFTKKAGAEPRAIPYERITHWEVDQGLFKLAIDSSGKPDIVEKTTQENFYPGLVLFTQLSAAPATANERMA